MTKVQNAKIQSPQKEKAPFVSTVKGSQNHTNCNKPMSLTNKILAILESDNASYVLGYN